MRSAAIWAIPLALGLTACGSHDGGGDPVQRVDPSSLAEADEPEGVAPDAVLRVDEVVLRNPDLSTLSRAVRSGGMSEALAAEQPVTLFAPDNSAFDKLGVDALTELMLPENKETLVRLLGFHIVPGRLTEAELRKRINDGGGSVRLESTQGEMLTASIELDQVRLADASGKVASITLADLAASNGVVHGIDEVLGPRE